MSNKTHAGSRSSVSGRFVTPQYAKSHPRSTTNERIPNPGRGDTGKKGKYHHASMHKEWRLAKEPEFRLLFLPPYSPDLNPIERVWKLIRRLRLHNRYFPELGNVMATVEDLFSNWTDRADVLRRLCKV